MWPRTSGPCSMVRGRWARAALAGGLLLALALGWRALCGGGAEPRAGRVPGRDLPLIFVGGVPRSGTTLMRAMLDAHPDVRCGQETRVLPRLLQMRQHWYRSDKERVRLREAGVTDDVLDNAIAAFSLEVIARHGEPAPRLCNKDPLMLKMGTYVLELFPKARFVFMVRDGRATVHSIISRQVTITGFDLSSYRQCLAKWNRAAEAMHRQCEALGERCLAVRYEELVLRPREQLARVYSFLGLTWSEAGLHHERYVGVAGGVALSPVERSSDQVARAVYREALGRWAEAGALPADVRADAAQLAPMLSVLGYDPWANPPVYAQPEDDNKM